MRNLDTGVFTADRSRDVIARRADGATLRSESLGPDADHRLRFHDVLFADGRIVTIYDSVKAKTTWPERALGFTGMRLPEAAADCGATAIGLDEWGAPDSRNEQFERIDAVEGEVVTVHAAISSSGRRESWRAPRLACEELYYRDEKQQGDSRVVMVEKTTKLIVGDHKFLS
jgi:hypothetical protein